MDRRSKIIVSVVGIFIVLLALVGITYGYFLTRVEGNTNDTSISITTANLRLVYRDGQNIEATNIQPGDSVYTKVFTVTNEGNASIGYEVYLENIINNFVHEEDLLMFVTCSSNIAGNTCNGYGTGSVSDNTPTFGDSIYPLVNSKLIENSIEPASDSVDAEVHTYTLYLKFKDDGSDQSDDMGKTLQGKIQIYDPKDVVAISGVVDITNAVENAEYYVELHSEVKTSKIASDGSYTIYGVKPDNHTLYVKYKVNNTETTLLTKEVVINKGDRTEIEEDFSTITFSDSTSQIGINIDIEKEELKLGTFVIDKEVITNYTQEDIDNSGGKLVAIGSTNALDVVAAFNDDYTSVIITKNGEDSNGRMKDYESLGNTSDSPMNQHAETLTSVTVSDGVTNIGAFLFYGMTNVSNVSLPDSLTRIETSAFAGMTSLSSIKLPDSVTTIGTNAFSRTGITSISLPDSLTSIGLQPFAYSSLESVIIPDGLTTIGLSMFLDCSQLTSVTIPNSVTNIDEDAFRGASALTSITYEGTIAEWNAINFVKGWNEGTGEYTIHCTDGDIVKQ